MKGVTSNLGSSFSLKKGIHPGKTQQIPGRTSIVGTANGDPHEFVNARSDTRERFASGVCKLFFLTPYRKRD